MTSKPPKVFLYYQPLQYICNFWTSRLEALYPISHLEQYLIVPGRSTEKWGTTSKCHQAIQFPVNFFSYFQSPYSHSRPFLQIHVSCNWLVPSIASTFSIFVFHAFPGGHNLHMEPNCPGHDDDWTNPRHIEESSEPPAQHSHGVQDPQWLTQVCGARPCICSKLLNVYSSSWSLFSSEFSAPQSRKAGMQKLKELLTTLLYFF